MEHYSSTRIGTYFGELGKERFFRVPDAVTELSEIEELVLKYNNLILASISLLLPLPLPLQLQYNISATAVLLLLLLRFTTTNTTTTTISSMARSSPMTLPVDS